MLQVGIYMEAQNEEDDLQWREKVYGFVEGNIQYTHNVLQETSTA
jgi:hypothetical protein